MLCFEAKVNDEPTITAGEAGISVLTAITTYVSNRNELDITVGGLCNRSATDNEHLRWLKRRLRAGDTVVLRVIETETADPPSSRDRADPDFVERERRRHYEELKREYEK
jgi:hypothetical protein